MSDGTERGTVRVFASFQVADEHGSQALPELIRAYHESGTALQGGENGTRHQGHTALIRAFADPKPPHTPFAVYDVKASYSE